MIFFMYLILVLGNLNKAIQRYKNLVPKAYLSLCKALYIKYL